MPKTVNVYTKRYGQITMTFMLFSFIEQFFFIEHAAWIVITGAVIYAGFNPGTVLKRAYHRLSGTVLGIVAVAIAWHIMHADHRLATLFYVLILTSAIFLCALPYNRLAILLTLLSDIVMQWGDPSDFYLEYYIPDRLICTLIVFGICIVIEYLWFGRSNLTYLNYTNVCENLKNDIRALNQALQNDTLSPGKVLKKITAISLKMDTLNLLLSDLVYEKSHDSAFTREEKQIAFSIIQTFRAVTSVYYLKKHDKNNPRLPFLNQQLQQSIGELAR